MSIDLRSTGYGPRDLPQRYDGDENNFELWLETFMAFLRMKGLHYAFDKYKDKKDPTIKIEDLKEKIYDVLCMCLDRNSLSMIRRDAKDDGVEALNVLKKFYLRTSPQRLLKLIREFFTYQMGESSVTSFLSKVDEMSTTLIECGQVISDEMIVFTVFNGLPPKYDSFVEIANQRHPAYKYPELKIAILNQEDIFKKKVETEFTEQSDQINNVNEKQ